VNIYWNLMGPVGVLYVKDIGDDCIIETDQDLLRLVQGQDETAWAHLVSRHQEAVFRLAYLILGDAAEAEEAAQDAFVQAYLSLDRFDAERPFRPWMMQIVRNVARNRQRSMRRYAAAVRRWWQSHAIPLEADLPHDDAQLLWQAVRRLPAAAQEVIYLRYFLGMSEVETAASLNIAPGTVKSRAHRALQRLRTIIQSDYPELATPE
ncbi:MAG: sigma-70 family RNA polymerase sigma factor, partial [Anaerolineales bacterium]|nr:sigma-70 family RNA polymerase sigma factor [Anaerolineales bacterium]